jgi:RNA 3'-phosphate cyclase
MIEIDGSYGEGGGSVLRGALALSALTSQAFRLHSIRKGRSHPGLQPQHVCAIEAAQRLCGATVEGAYKDSASIIFSPEAIRAGEIRVDVGTAGSVTLLLQAVLLPAMFAPGTVRLKLTGGTDTKWSMPFDYLKQVAVPGFSHFAEIEVSLDKRGYYPKGGGKITVEIVPHYCRSDYPGLDAFCRAVAEGAGRVDLVERGKLISMRGVSHASLGLQRARVAERQAEAAGNLVREQLAHAGVDPTIEEVYEKTLSPGSGICLWALYESGSILGGDGLGERGKPAEDVGIRAAAQLLAQMDSGGCVDRYLADQLVSIIALFGGRYYASEVTRHTKTNVWVAEKFLGKRIEIVDRLLCSIARNGIEI